MNARVVLFLSLFCIQTYSFDALQSHILGGIVYPGDIASAQLERALQKLLSEAVPSKAVYDFDTIDMPGIYILDANVSNQITISVSNVTLDMHGHTVSGGTNGIVVNGGLSNITIKNGVINSVSSDGIQVGAGCSNITIKGVEVKNALRAIDFEQVSNGVIKNCDLNLSTTGLELDGCHNITVRNCTARANTHAGYDLLASTTCSVIECSALSTGDGNSDISSEVFGFITKDGNGNLFERCIANATQALSVTGSDSVVAGFALCGSESCTKIIDSEASNTETNVNGFTVPYGVLVEQTVSDLSQVDSVSIATSTIVLRPRWSPDGRYIVTSEEVNTEETRIFEFDRVSVTLTEIVGIVSGDVTDSEWSPDGQFIIVVKAAAPNPNMILYEFDPILKTLVQRDSEDNALARISASWRFDGIFFATGESSATVNVYKLDGSSKSFSLVESITTSGENRSVNWSRDGNFFAVVNRGGDDMLRIYQFDLATETLTLIDSVGIISDGYFVQFSPDDQYIAVLRENAGPVTNVVIYSFDGSSVSLIASAGTGTSFFGDLDWSSDGKFLAVAGAGPQDELKVYEFDRGIPELIEVGTFDNGNILRGVDWSPDGGYIVTGGTEDASNPAIRVLTGFNSPENNVIQNNTVYCNSGAQFPSGIGISGSSISNSIIQNTAFNNPIPRGDREPVVESNYAFATNVFNQLFGDAPTLLQNISLSGIDPILNRYDIPTQLLRLEALAESLIDNLL